MQRSERAGGPIYQAVFSMQSQQDRDETLAHFQAITGMHDLEECRACLEAHSWNLDDAVQSALAHHDAPVMQSYGQVDSNSAPFGASNARGRDAVDVPPPGPEVAESRGLFHSITGVPLWNVVSSMVRIASRESACSFIRCLCFRADQIQKISLRAVGTIRPEMASAATQLPPQEIQQFIDQLERDYGKSRPGNLLSLFGFRSCA